MKSILVALEITIPGNATMVRKEKKRTDLSRSGFVYIASNPTMPGLVKAGLTRGSLDDRLRNLYTTGVPEPFFAECARFFVDCVEAEIAIKATLEVAGRRCHNREFFQLDKHVACEIVERHYLNQHKLRRNENDFDWEACDAFRESILSDNWHWPGLIINSLRCLEFPRREKVLQEMLATSIDLGNENVAIELIQNHGVDPEVPLILEDYHKGIALYYFTAYEKSISLCLHEVNGYLTKIGCNLDNSTALSLVIDCLINDSKTDDWKDRLVQIALRLLERGADIYQVLNIGLFFEAPRKKYMGAQFKYDIFPRNSGMTCYEIAAKLALTNIHFAKLYPVMSEIASTTESNPNVS